MVNQNQIDSQSQSQFTTNKFISNNFYNNEDQFQKYDYITANTASHVSQLKLHDLKPKISNETYLNANSNYISHVTSNPLESPKNISQSKHKSYLTPVN